MRETRDTSLPDDLRPVAALLEEHRPRASEARLARVRARARAGAAPGRTYFPRERGLLVRPRLAITFILTTGLLMSGTGATLAVISDGDSAAISQYPGTTVGGGVVGGGGGVAGDTQTGQAPRGAVQGDVQEGVEAAPEAGGGTAGDQGGVLGDVRRGGEVAGDRAEGGGVQGATTQADRQVGAGGGGELPFTGLLTIPLIAGGIVLLVSGLALRRVARRPAGA